MRGRSSQIVTVLLAAIFIAILLLRKLRWPALGFIFGTTPAAFAQHQPTVVHVGPRVVQDHVERFGINLGAHNYYDSGQIMQNLLYRNPNFEGEQWQSIVQCGRSSPTSCTDKADSSWPAGFWDGGSYEVIVGAAKGQTGKITHSSGVDQANHLGVTVNFDPAAKAPAVNDYIVLRKQDQGGATLGWGSYGGGGAAISGETTDLSPLTQGTQALRISAAGPGQYETINQGFDSVAGHTFLQLHGPYVIKFRAKKVAGKPEITVGMRRLAPSGNEDIFQQKVSLTSDWKDYALSFEAKETANLTGTVEFGIGVEGSEILLDDVSLESAKSNGTAFRQELIDTLQTLHPGVLRYMDSGQNWGSSLDNVLAVESARKRSNFIKYTAQADDLPIGLHDFLVLSEKIGANPWYAMQVGMSEQEARDLMDYLGGPVTTKYGAKRAALGHPKPWTEVFSMIHLEFGNEAWNGIFQGAMFPEPQAYASRATAIFGAIRTSPSYSQQHYDLVANGFAVSTDWNRAVIESGDGFDTIDVAPYLFARFFDDSSTEHIFGPMFAEPEMLVSSKNGYLRRQADVAAHAKRPVRLGVYETNIGTDEGTVGQASLDATVPSVGAGITVLEGMLLMLRDLGIKVQNLYELTSYSYRFNNTATHKTDESEALWGNVVDMGVTNRKRPSFLAQMLANEAIRSNMMETRITGDDPTWDQPKSANSGIELQGAHELQSFAFTDGKTDTVILFNLSRTNTRSLALDGPNSPRGAVKVETLTGAKITDNNENSENVKVVSRDVAGVARGKTTFDLPPFSMTTLTSTH